MGLAVALFLGVACASLAPLPEGNAFVRGLVGAQRQREEAVSLYTYDVTEVRDELDRDGRTRRRETRAYEVFHVKGRPVRRLVAKDGRPLEGKEREKEERMLKGPGSFFVKKNCFVCHSVSTLGIEAAAQIGPDLALAVQDVQARFGRTLEDFLSRPTGTMDVVLSTMITLSPEERKEAVEKLRLAYELKQQETVVKR